MQDGKFLPARLSVSAGGEESTAHYIAMRALGEPDAFPSGRLGSSEHRRNARQSNVQSGNCAGCPKLATMARLCRNASLFCDLMPGGMLSTGSPFQAFEARCRCSWPRK